MPENKNEYPSMDRTDHNYAVKFIGRVINRGLKQGPDVLPNSGLTIMAEPLVDDSYANPDLGPTSTAIDLYNSVIHKLRRNLTLLIETKDGKLLNLSLKAVSDIRESIQPVLDNSRPSSAPAPA